MAGKKKSKKKDTYPRKGYTMVAFRARDEVVAVIDECVRAANENERKNGFGEPKVTRTTVLLDAVKVYFALGDAGVAGPEQKFPKGAHAGE